MLFSWPVPLVRVLSGTRSLSVFPAISPVSVGQRLNELLPESRLHVLVGGTHSLAQDRPDDVAALIVDHLDACVGRSRRRRRRTPLSGCARDSCGASASPRGCPCRTGNRRSRPAPVCSAPTGCPALKPEPGRRWSSASRTFEPPSTRTWKRSIGRASIWARTGHHQRCRRAVAVGEAK